MIGHFFAAAWTAAAIFFLISVASASLIGLVRKARARGKRLFRDEPLARVHALKSNATHAYEQDAV
jgi:hypothetical protein